LGEINYLVQLGRLGPSSELRSDYYLQGNPHDGDGDRDGEAGVGDGDEDRDGKIFKYY